MMKRVVFFLTMVFGAALPALLAGCGKLNDQEPAVKATGALTNGSGPLTLSDGSSMPGNESKTGVVDIQQPSGPSGETKTLVTRDGTVYEGEMKDGKPNGLGTVTDAKGTFQKGEWRDSRPYRVSGTWVEADGTKEVGTWNYDGTTSGGTIWWNDGRIYKGEWEPVHGQTDLPDGMGAMTWPDGRQYAGRFRDGKMDGVGKMTYADGKVADGTWKQDAFQGPAK